MVPSNVEPSGIDDESYLVVNEEDWVDGVANYLAKCIRSNPKAQDMTPEDLQKTLAKALDGVGKVEKIQKMVYIYHAGKMFYNLTTWVWDS